MIRILSGLLVLQILLVALFYWPENESGKIRPALLHGTSAKAIDSIRITSTDDDGAELTLEEIEGEWRLADSNLPAARDKVDTLLYALTQRDPGFPIAQTAEAAKRFEVSAEKFQRKLTLTGAEAENVVYLGSSPAFRKVHARVEGDDAIFVAELNTYDADTNADQWLDRSLLGVQGVNGLQVGSQLDEQRYAIVEDTWQNADGSAVNSEDLETLLTGLSSLRVSGVLENETELDTAESTLTVRAERDAGPVTLSILHNADDERYYLHSDAYPQVFNTSAFDAERIIEATAKLRPGSAGDTDDKNADVSDEGVDSESGEETDGETQ
ncbi:MAG: hypothetical protein Cons2KO_14100 [Congregibacter sp.]